MLTKKIVEKFYKEVLDEILEITYSKDIQNSLIMKKEEYKDMIVKEFKERKSKKWFY